MTSLPALPSVVRHTVRTSTLVVLVLVLVGATYQGIATALERQRYEYPGRMVPVGAHLLHIHCEGEGSPTVVLEAPEAGMSAMWGPVQAAVAAETRVCSYDRAGLGWSQRGGEQYAADNVAPALHTLLVNAGERPPLVMAGAGLSSAFLRHYASTYPSEVASLVLAGPTPGPAPERFARLLAASPWLARVGVLRATGLLSRLARGLPEPSAGRLRTFLNRPDHLTRASVELAAWEDAAALADRAEASAAVVRVATPSANPPGWMASPEAAAAVVDGILDAVRDARTPVRLDPPG